MRRQCWAASCKCRGQFFFAFSGHSSREWKFVRKVRLPEVIMNHGCLHRLYLVVKSGIGRTWKHRTFAHQHNRNNAIRPASRTAKVLELIYNYLHLSIMKCLWCLWNIVFQSTILAQDTASLFWRYQGATSAVPSRRRSVEHFMTQNRGRRTTKSNNFASLDFPRLRDRRSPPLNITCNCLHHGWPCNLFWQRQEIESFLHSFHTAMFPAVFTNKQAFRVCSVQMNPFFWVSCKFVGYRIRKRNINLEGASYRPC